MRWFSILVCLFVSRGALSSKMPSTPIAANSLLAPSTSHSRCCGDVSCDLATVGETKTAIESARNRGADNSPIVISYSSTTEATRCNTRRRDFTLGSAQRFFLGFALSKTMPFPVPGIGSSLLPLPILTAAAFCPMNLDTVTMRAPIFICPVHYIILRNYRIQCPGSGDSRPFFKAWEWMGCAGQMPETPPLLRPGANGRRRRPRRICLPRRPHSAQALRRSRAAAGPSSKRRPRPHKPADWSG